MTHLSKADYQRYMREPHTPKDRLRVAIMSSANENEEFAWCSLLSRFRTGTDEVRAVFIQLNRHSEVIRDEKEGWWKIGPRFRNPMERATETPKPKPELRLLRGTPRPNRVEEEWRKMRGEMKIQLPKIIFTYDRDPEV